MKKMYIKHWLTVSILTVVLLFNTAEGAFSQSSFKMDFIESQQSQIEKAPINSSFKTGNYPINGGIHQTKINSDSGSIEFQNSTTKNITTTIVQEPYAVHEFNVRNSPTVSIRSNNGSIKVEKSNDGEVRIEMFVSRSGLAILSSERLEDYRFVFRQRHNNIYAEVISTKNSAWSSNTPAFDFVVFVPEESNASLITNAGNISISGIQGEMDARTSKGQIRVNNTQGTIRLSTASGDVEVDSHKGIVFTNSIHGNINYNNVQGESRIKVVSGNVTLDEICGSTLVQSTNGNIDYNALMVDQLVDLNTIVGNITASIPKSGAFNLDFQGQRVNLNTFDSFVGDVQRTYIIGSMNGGGVPVHATSKLGNVNIRIKH